MCAGPGTAHHLRPARPAAPGPMSGRRPDVTQPGSLTKRTMGRLQRPLTMPLRDPHTLARGGLSGWIPPSGFHRGSLCTPQIPEGADSGRDIHSPCPAPPPTPAGCPGWQVLRCTLFVPPNLSPDPARMPWPLAPLTRERTAPGHFWVWRGHCPAQPPYPRDGTSGSPGPRQ